jgi:hypothetical protein
LEIIDILERSRDVPGDGHTKLLIAEVLAPTGVRTVTGGERIGIIVGRFEKVLRLQSIEGFSFVLQNAHPIVRLSKAILTERPHNKIKLPDRRVDVGAFRGAFHQLGRDVSDEPVQFGNRMKKSDLFVSIKKSNGWLEARDQYLSFYDGSIEKRPEKD